MEYERWFHAKLHRRLLKSKKYGVVYTEVPFIILPTEPTRSVCFYRTDLYLPKYSLSIELKRGITNAMLNGGQGVSREQYPQTNQICITPETARFLPHLLARIEEHGLRIYYTPADLYELAITKKLKGKKLLYALETKYGWYEQVTEKMGISEVPGPQLSHPRDH